MSVYFIRSAGLIKIGRSEDINGRFRRIAAGQTYEHQLIGAVAGGSALETLHKKLKAYRVRGEWFKDCKYVRAEILRCLKSYPPPNEDAKGPWLFAEICRILWPGKTAAHLATIAKCNERTAKRWLAGEYEPPVVVILAVINKMFER